MEFEDTYVTKAFSLCAALYLLIANLAKGVLFPYKFDQILVQVFHQEVFTYKLRFLFVFMIIVTSLALIMLIISIAFSKLSYKADERKVSAVCYEIAACVMLITASVIYYLGFRNECAFTTTLKGSWMFIAVNIWLLFATGYKISIIVRSKAKTVIKFLIPGIVIAAFCVAASMFVLSPVFLATSGYDNYKRDLRKIDDRFEIEGSNSLHGGVVVDDMIYAVVGFPVEDDRDITRFVSIDEDGTIEVIDDHFILPRNVAKSGDTVFYSKYNYKEDNGFMIGIYDTRTGTQDVFNANHVSSDRKSLFGNYTSLLGVRDNYLYLAERDIDEIWRVRIRDGQLDRESFERYAWGIQKNYLNVCYSNLEKWNDTESPWKWILYSDVDNDIDIQQFRIYSSELEEDIGDREIYLNEIWAKPKGNVMGGRKINHVIAANIYKGDVYYAVIENGLLTIYRTDPALEEQEFLGQFETDVEYTYRYSFDARIIVSDSYLVFFNYRDYKIISF